MLVLQLSLLSRFFVCHGSIRGVPVGPAPPNLPPRLFFYIYRKNKGRISSLLIEDGQIKMEFRWRILT